MIHFCLYSPTWVVFLKSVVYYRRNKTPSMIIIPSTNLVCDGHIVKRALLWNKHVAFPHRKSTPLRKITWTGFLCLLVSSYPKKTHIPVRFQNTQHGHCYNGKFIQIMKFSIGYRNITTLLYRLNFWSLLQTHHGPWSIFRCLFCGNCSFGVTILQSYRSHRMVSSGMEAIALKKWVDQMTSKSVWKTKGWNAGKFKQLSEHPDKRGPRLVRAGSGMKNYPVELGDYTEHDPYQTTRIQWKVTVVLNVFSVAEV